MPGSQSQIVVVGSHAPGLFIRVHRVPKAGETVIGWDFNEPKDGGKGSNQAIASARLGIPTSFVGSIGDDRLGAEGESWMMEEGIDLSYLYHSSVSKTGLGFILLDENGIPAMVTSMGANEQLSCEQVEDALNGLSQAKVMLTQFEINPEVALYAAKVAQDHGMTTILNPAPAVTINLSRLAVADILVPNEAEAKILLGYEPDAPLDLEAVAGELMTQAKAGSVIVTAGERGIVGIDSSGSWQSLPPKVDVVDTSGAGDVFCAALAVSLTRGLNLRAASAWACQVAALSVTKAGTIPSFPNAAEADEFCATSKGAL
jgi:ribokinase